MMDRIFYGVSLSNVRVIMTIMCVLSVELCQVVMGQILALKCVLLGTCWLWLGHVLFDIKWPRYLRILALEPLTRY
jgi:hypothetical protein